MQQRLADPCMGLKNVKIWANYFPILLGLLKLVLNTYRDNRYMCIFKAVEASMRTYFVGGCLSEKEELHEPFLAPIFQA